MGLRNENTLSRRRDKTRLRGVARRSPRIPFGLLLLQQPLLQSHLSPWRPPILTVFHSCRKALVDRAHTGLRHRERGASGAVSTSPVGPVSSGDTRAAKGRADIRERQVAD